MTEEEVLKKIEQAAKGKLTALDLSGMKIDELPPEIGKLNNLTVLYLGDNQLTALPPEIGKLNNLMELYLYNNQLTALPPEIGQLNNLMGLMGLYVHNNQLTALPPGIGRLNNLTELTLSNNQLTVLPPEIGKLNNLTTLYLPKNQLTALPPEIGKLNNLTTLYLPNNQLTALPPEIGELNKLKVLQLAGNQLAALPPEIGKLNNLTELWLQENQLTALPPEIGKLDKLQRLVVRDNPLTSLPPEVVKGGSPAVLEYYRKLAAAEAHRYEAKLILVGQGKVGKTCLSRALRGLPFENQETTHGIEVQRLTEQHPKVADQEITFNVWDFGGQHITHSTHQFFLTERSLYLLVFNARLEAEAGRLNYWLDTIRARAPKAQVLLVATEYVERKPKLDYDRLRERFKDLLVLDDYLRVDSETGLGIKELKKKICRRACDLELMGHKWPGAYATVEEKITALAESGTAHTERHELYQIMSDAGIEGETNQESLARILGDLGKITHFPSSFQLRDLIVFSPQWLTQAISKALEYQPLVDADGLLKHEWLVKLWKKDYRGLHAVFHRCMEEFEICYSLDHDPHHSLVPLRFKPGKPEIKWSDEAGRVTRRLIYRFRFIPAGLMARFTVKTHRMSTGKFWENGVFLKKGEAEALCQQDPDRREITIEVRSVHPQNFLEKLSEYLEAILDDYQGLKPDKLLGCIGDPPEMPACPGEFEYEELLDDLSEGIHKKRCHRGRHYVKTLEVVYALTAFADHWEVLQSIESNTRDTRLDVKGLKIDIEVLGHKLVEMFEHQQSILLDWMWSVDEEIFNLCPTLVSITPVDRRKVNPANWFNEEYRLRLYCQAEEGIHPVGKTYPFSQTRAWWQKTSPYLYHFLNVLKVVSGPAGVILPNYVPQQNWDTIKKEFEAMASVLDEIDVEALKDEKPDYTKYRGESTALEGTALRAISALLKEKDPHDSWKDVLTRVPTPDGKALWLCDEHKQKYMPRRVEF